MYERERKWIKDKIAKGQSQDHLLNCVGSFSNKKKSRVMQEKRLTSTGYNKRYSFLSKVYYLLINERF